MRKILVESMFDESKGVWTAEAAGKTVTGSTPRQLRGELERVARKEGLNIDHRVRYPKGLETKMESLRTAGEALDKARAAHERSLDKLNVKRLSLAEKMQAQNCTVEMIAEALDMHPQRVHQLLDPRHYTGRRVRDLRDKKIEPGTAPSSRRGALDDD